MRTTAAAWLLALAVLAGPIEAPVGTHAVRGVVKSVSTSSLMIARPGRRALDMTFTLTSATAREGTIAIGTVVSIRYVTDGRTLVATAVSASPEGACRGDIRR